MVFCNVFPTFTTRWCISPFLADVSILTYWIMTLGCCWTVWYLSAVVSQFCLHHICLACLFFFVNKRIHCGPVSQRISVKKCYYDCTSYSPSVLKPCSFLTNMRVILLRQYIFIWQFMFCISLYILTCSVVDGGKVADYVWSTEESLTFSFIYIQFQIT